MSIREKFISTTVQPRTVGLRSHGQYYLRWVGGVNTLIFKHFASSYIRCVQLIKVFFPTDFTMALKRPLDNSNYSGSFSFLQGQQIV